jgi:mannose-6-phosphate isomerase class I
MSFKKFRWSQVYESSEEELVAFLQARGIDGQRIHADATTPQTEQQTKSATTVWCAEGSLVINMGETRRSLQPGDALQLETDTTYTIQPGIADCVYYLTR